MIAARVSLLESVVSLEEQRGRADRRLPIALSTNQNVLASRVNTNLSITSKDFPCVFQHQWMYKKCQFSSIFLAFTYSVMWCCTGDWKCFPNSKLKISWSGGLCEVYFQVTCLPHLLSDVMLHWKLTVHSKLQLWWNACMHQLVDTKSSFWKMLLTSQSESLPSVVFLNDKNW
jgi:hypothetical protein